MGINQDLELDLNPKSTTELNILEYHQIANINRSYQILIDNFRRNSLMTLGIARLIIVTEI